MHFKCPNHNKISGLSLIEVMVSMVLLAISMLGLAAMQNNSTRIDYQAHLRTQSVAQVIDMVDRMRTNVSGATGGFYTADPAPTSYTVDCGDVSNTCTAEQLADYDYVVWNQINSARLPGGLGDITVVGDPADRNFQVSVFWQEPHEGIQVSGYVNPCDGSANEDIHCYQLVIRL